MVDNDTLGREALRMHAAGRPGKVEVTPTKPLTTQYQLSLAYSPGVAAPCLEIEKDPGLAYDYTAKGNMVAVISNGTAVLGLGNIGALASKPVMEGKAVLFKRFADVDGIDLEVDTEDVDAFIECVRYLGKSFGGINLEDIKAPECFIVEERLRELLDIPVFHDDQHGTAVVTAAALVNWLELTGRRLEDVRLVCSGAGAAAIAGLDLLTGMGLRKDSVIVADSRGIIYEGRDETMEPNKARYAARTDLRTVGEAMAGADAFLGVSTAGLIDADMVRAMARDPLVLALANPDPEICPPDAHAARPDVTIATGRSDYPNQVNNVLCFPFLFRGALDVGARTVNLAMKAACVRALAELARSEPPEIVRATYPGELLAFGPGYLVPKPFDPRLAVDVPIAVARAAMESGVASRPIEDMESYRQRLQAFIEARA